jgi:hypothetical protein
MPHGLTVRLPALRGNSDCLVSRRFEESASAMIDDWIVLDDEASSTAMTPPDHSRLVVTVCSFSSANLGNWRNVNRVCGHCAVRGGITDR